VRAFSGFFLRIPIWDQPKGEQVFDDASYWTVPEDGFPFAETSEDGHHGGATELSKRHEKEPFKGPSV
jgi:hypothetical protein